MKKALIVYQSKKGHTKRYGEEIGKFLQEKGITSKVIAVEEFKADQIENVSCLFLGCWTSGLFLFLQHPDRIWINRYRKYVQSYEKSYQPTCG
jgi:flavorubredoxin